MFAFKYISNSSLYANIIIAILKIFLQNTLLR